MGQLTRDCPHCHTKKVSFVSFGDFIVPNTNDYITAFYCGSCHGGYIARIYSGVTPNSHGFNGNIEANNNYRIMDEYPLPLYISSPKHLPENLDSFYLQAANSLRAGNYDASAMMSRKVLEVAVKTLSPDGEGKLYHRIEKLADDGKITPELKDWAHIIRDDGNEAAHEEKPVSPEFAKELLSFAEMFLMYTFTMPGMIADRRPAPDEKDA